MKERSTMKDPSVILRAAAVVVLPSRHAQRLAGAHDAARAGLVGRVDLGAVSAGLERGGLRA